MKWLYYTYDPEGNFIAVYRDRVFWFGFLTGTVTSLLLVDVWLVAYFTLS